MQFLASAAAAALFSLAGPVAADFDGGDHGPDDGSPPRPPPNGMPPPREMAWVWFGRSNTDLPLGIRVPVGQLTPTAVQTDEVFVSLQVDAGSADVVCISRGTDGSQTSVSVGQGKVSITSPQLQDSLLCGHG